MRRSGQETDCLVEAELCPGVCQQNANQYNPYPCRGVDRGDAVHAEEQVIRPYTVQERYAMLAGVDEMSGIGISLKPPKWLRNAVAKVQKAVPKGTMVKVDMGNGKIVEVDASDPNALAAFRKELEAAKVSVSLPPIRFGVPNTPDVTQVATPSSGPFGMDQTGILVLGGLALVAMMMMRGK
jgi:hypothetical protein